VKKELERRLERIDALVAQLENGADPASRAAAQQLVQSVMELQGAGMERILELVRASGDAGKDLMDRLTRDELVKGLLLLYDLHPVDVETRVRDALARALPSVESHGGRVELVSIDGQESVRLRLQGPLSQRGVLEKALQEAAPDVASIVIDWEEPLVRLERRR
jgi:Fe-S cluster biogenesis protein NfuA